MPNQAPRTHYDLAIIGGGINGAGIARDAAGRGMSVFLADKGDFGGATSSASSKLIHGGLRYLETYEFSLVRESLRERKILMNIAPHLVKPISFLIPITKDQKRPVWFVRLGLWFYDRLAGTMRLGRSRALKADEISAFTCLRQDNLKAVLKYQDCQTDDNRLVLSTLFDAEAHGAQLHNYTQIMCIWPDKHGTGYVVQCKNKAGEIFEITASHVVNAAGPWVNRVNDCVKDMTIKRYGLKLVRGSHLIVKRSQQFGDAAFTLQNDDGRIVFAIPWGQTQDYLLIGTTDKVQDSLEDGVYCSDEERDYLIASYNRYFPDVALSTDDIIDRFAGVRPLAYGEKGNKNPSKVTRDFTLTHTVTPNGGFICVYGGKITTYRVLAQKVLALLPPSGKAVKQKEGWTGTTLLHAAPKDEPEIESLSTQGSSDIPKAIKERWVHSYGQNVKKIYQLYDEGQGKDEIVKGVLEAELLYVCKHEYCQSAEDFLGHRSWLKLTFSDKEIQKAKDWFEAT